MRPIRYVCLSDTHFGAATGLLTQLTPDCRDIDPRTASPVLVHLVECLKALLGPQSPADRPTLILNGDILEPALSTENEAAMAFESLVHLVLPANRDDWLFREIRYTPGNHGHHLWEAAFERQYVEYISTHASRKTSGGRLHAPWYTTKMFNPDPVPATLVNGLLQRPPPAAGAGQPEVARRVRYLEHRLRRSGGAWPRRRPRAWGEKGALHATVGTRLPARRARGEVHGYSR